MEYLKFLDKICFDSPAHTSLSPPERLFFFHPSCCHQRPVLRTREAQAHHLLRKCRPPLAWRCYMRPKVRTQINFETAFVFKGKL